MSNFSEALFFSKEAYLFKKTEPLTGEQYIHQELLFQLSDLEARCIHLGMGPRQGERSINRVQYQRKLLKIDYRLEDLIRFLNQFAGPVIFRFVCSEILDFIREKEWQKVSLQKEAIYELSTIFSLMSDIIHPEIFEISPSLDEEKMQNLKSTTENLFLQFS